jgi:hypothetical protein
MRVGAAVALAAVILLGADTLPARVSGLLLAFPITGSILPSFTLPAYGHPATVNLLRGFANGLIGFAAFFLALPALLGAGASRAAAFLAALSAAVLAAWLVHRFRGAAARWPSDP